MNNKKLIEWFDKALHVYDGRWISLAKTKVNAWKYLGNKDQQEKDFNNILNLVTAHIPLARTVS
ncbi:hypothetical protein NX722_14380 [Endozoicomonas gorgoniicola]|uniref:Uncharacterized protein n=1 Tax=Endozoicomonas gorgoniicola TaxID=1234144 RepID=A0ABT3MWN8_9GAMM|nr:hypothetical protein [Endozoicomonas gorgoniicola]MCW7553792.1 hypothetical protein [Endozoicomonas gorgoniicola]